MESLPSPLSWQVQSVGLFPESDHNGKTHSVEFPRTQPASSGSESLQHCGPGLFPGERKRGPTQHQAEEWLRGSTRGHSAEVCCDTEKESSPACVGDSVSTATPLPPSAPGRPAESSGPPCIWESVGVRLSAFLRPRRKSGCIFGLTYFQKNSICLGRTQHPDVICSLKILKY